MENSVVHDKQALRIEMRRRRASVSGRAERSASVWSKVLSLCDDTASALSQRRTAPLRVLAFSGVGSEPDTDGLIEQLSGRGYSVALPRVEGDHIVAVPYVSGDRLRTGAYGIPEPGGVACDPVSIDVVIVPGLAFTRDGRRLGQGGGYYDRFLALVGPDCVTCGVGFDEQLVDDLPSEPHDRALATVITDGEAD